MFPPVRHRSTVLRSLLLAIAGTLLGAGCRSGEIGSDEAKAALQEQGGVVLVLEARADSPLSDEERAAIGTGIRDRLATAGIEAFSLDASGATFTLRFPGMAADRRTELEEQVLRRGKLELRSVSLQGSGGGGSLAELVYKGEQIEPGFGGYKHDREDRDGKVSTEFLLLDNRVPVSGADVEDAYPQLQGAENIVAVELTAAGAKKMRAFTAPMQAGRDRIAVLLDDEVLVAPVVMATPLGGNFVISGQDDLVESRAVAASLKHPLPAPLEVKRFEHVPPAAP
mgnify:CR=1 FL=1